MMRALPFLALAALAALPAAPAAAQQAAVAPAATLSLDEAIRIAQRQGPDARAAASARDRTLLDNRAFRARLLPQLSLTGTAPAFERAINPVPLQDGSLALVQQGFVRSGLDLRMLQQVPAIGGSFYLSSGLGRLDVLGSEVRSSQRWWNSTPLVLGFTQELFRPRQLLWESREQRLQAEAAERRWVESREEVAGTVVERYFDAWAATVAADNAAANVAVNDTLFTLNKGRYEVGRIGENDLLQSELALLRARATLDGARLEEQRTLAALRIALDLPPSVPLAVSAPPVLDAAVRPDTTRAVASALRARARMVELDLDKVRADRSVTTARLDNGFNARVTAEVGLNQSATQLDSAYQGLLNQQRASVTVQMPLFQWGGGRAEVAAAEAERERVEHVSRRVRAEVEQEAHFAALQFAQSVRLLELSAKADTVAAKRFEVARQRYIIGRIGVTDLYIAQQEKDNALDAYVRSLRAYWRDWYRLRRLTLWDFAADQPLAAAR